MLKAQSKVFFGLKSVDIFRRIGYDIYYQGVLGKRHNRGELTEIV